MLWRPVAPVTKTSMEVAAPYIQEGRRHRAGRDSKRHEGGGELKKMNKIGLVGGFKWLIVPHLHRKPSD